ncbi:uncharacterized protein Tco025E_00890 [Trypanosoma conorhini]|uniref:Uncharacterized protein n=1 Tax=Trypanosoma conorhini TaxID=83891 RepID=A0A3R7NTT8_9TRYP|nr:uncharacterized protein Tco025E_00890 [Trypanosoma conorhini]RNF26927.1 hypothetical protein Tco025E_00890 [Trypanosoma conorhini]
MLNCEERDVFIEALVRRKILLNTLQAAVQHGGASKRNSGMKCHAPSMATWEKEVECARWCETLASDPAMTPEEKHNVLVAKLRSMGRFDADSITDLEAWSPFFALAASLAMLSYGQFSSEHQVALVELAMTYTAKGAYARARKILKTLLLRGEKLDQKTALLHGELQRFLLLVEAKHFTHSDSITSTRLLPLCFSDHQKNCTVQYMKCLLEESEQRELSPLVLLYCYLGVIGAALVLWLKLKDKGQELRLKEDIIRKTSQATSQNELQALKEEAHRRFEQKHAINLKKETTRQFIDSILHRCEKFLQANRCADYAAVWTFSFAKLRWEREHGGPSLLRFAERFIACCRDAQLDPLLSTIFLNEANLALKGNETITSYACDLSGVKLPLMRDSFASYLLLPLLGVGEEVSLSPSS